MKSLLLLLLAAILTTSSSSGYKVLVLIPAPSHSHNTLGKGIVDALLKGGHEVTWATPYPDKVKNPPKSLRILDISSVQRFVTGLDMSDRKTSSGGVAFVKAFSTNVTLEMINTPSVKETLVKQQYDAVVTETFFCDFLAGVAAVQQAPWIVLAATQIYPQLEAQMDEARSVATIPLMFNPSEIPMGFLKRSTNVLIHLAMTVAEWLDRPNTISLYEKTFAPLAAARGVKLPPFDEAFHNVSIMFVNSHESISPPVSISPNVVNIAGYHMDENIPPLPKDLQDLLDGSPQGFVYFSMGSVIRSASLKPHTRAALLQLFSKLPYTVLWKFEEPLTGLPPNVHVRPWMPQPSILAHKNIKVFITHGGQLSSLEAIRAGVPLLAVPVFGDQLSNADRAERAGYARTVDFSDDMAPELERTLKELLSNDKYAKRAKYLSHLFQSRPAKPADLINHYVTLAIETKGAYHLRSVSQKYSWYERWMLDFVAAVLTVLAVLIALLKFLIKSAIRKVSGKKVYKEKGGKKKRN
ncbi:hypothetical protein PYW07_013032 [Mythimna separata]|uniref:UDP-glucuronosyltransferase n=1 Tax=Mythimna separata TaxID=271217 RepID=A0AAD7Y5R3_MYTSE|nr:hypothetical protein PYW07_013032 [Mythimna separata]